MIVAILTCWLFFVGSVGLFVLGFDPTHSFLGAGTIVGVFGFGLCIFEFMRTVLNGR
jgi:hypothetical protein